MGWNDDGVTLRTDDRPVWSLPALLRTDPQRRTKRWVLAPLGLHVRNK